MTILSKRKTRLTFETDNIVRGRSIVVEPEPLVCTLRLKGQRHRMSINWETVLMAAAEIAARKIREQRKLARQARRAGKKGK